MTKQSLLPAIGAAISLTFAAGAFASPLLEKANSHLTPGVFPENPDGICRVTPCKESPLKRNIPAETSDTPVLYGWTTYNSLWNKNENNYGVYSFPVKPLTTFSLTWPTKNVSSGAWADGKLCGYYVLNYGGAIAIRYYMYDGDNGALVTEQPFNSQNTSSLYSHYALGLAYNYTDATLYGEFLTADQQQVCISSVDPLTGEPTQITALDGDIIYLALAFDDSGRLYGIGDDGILYSISLPDGEVTAIGPTGLTPQYYQSATIDYASGRMFWAYMGSDMSTALYEVDLATGHATLASEYDGTVEIVGLYSDRTAGGAVPAPVSDLAVTYPADASLEATVSFTAPTLSADGLPLDNTPLKVSLFVDYKKVADAPATVIPGETYSYSCTLANGTHKVEALLSNAAGYADRPRLLTYAGTDIPGQVRNLAFALDGRNATVTWEAPATGANGGWFDNSGLSYNVVRFPDNVQVASALTATSFSEEIPDCLGNYFYEVTPVGTKAGAPAQSNRILYGTAMTIPYKETFDTDAPLDLFAIDDANNDGYYWRWKNGVMVDGRGDAENAADWLITPPVALTGEWIYRLSFKAHAVGTFYTETFNAGIGTGTTGGDFTILGSYSVQGESFATFSANVEIKQPGNYRIGIQHTTAGNITRDELYIDDIEIVPFISTKAPASVENLKVTNLEGNLLKGTMEFTAPVTAIDGTPLTSLSGIEILCDDAVVKNISDAVPGQKYTFDIDIPQGEHTFNVICHNEIGRGHDSLVKAFGGIDVPLPVTNIRYIWNSSDNNKATILWDAPAPNGVHGHAIDPSAITYDILSPMWGTYIPSVTGLKECSAQISVSATSQTLAQRGVQAVTSGGKSEIQMVYINVGPAIALDAVESFKDGAITYPTWSISALVGYAPWAMYNSNPDILEAQDGDNGYAMSKVARGEGPAEGRLISPAFDFSSTQPAWLHVWVHHSTSVNRGTQLIIEYTDNGCDYNPVGAPIAVNDGTNGWKKHHISLDRLSGMKRAMLGFHSVLPDASSYVAFDNMAIDHQAGVENILDNAGDSPCVTAYAGGISISGADGQPYGIFTPDGKTVACGIAASSGSDIPVAPGIYIVRVGRTVFKITVG